MLTDVNPNVCQDLVKSGFILFILICLAAFHILKSDVLTDPKIYRCLFILNKYSPINYFLLLEYSLSRTKEQLVYFYLSIPSSKEIKVIKRARLGVCVRAG